MSVIIYPKGSLDRVGAAFEAREFDCPCAKCRDTLLDVDLITGLDKMRQLLAVPIIITSGFRCQNYQLDLEKRGYETAKKSAHLQGRAVDLKTGKHTGLELEEIALQAGFQAIGVARTWIHVDTRGFETGPRRRWGYRS